MKIALCLTGQPRGIAINTPHLLKFLVEPSNIQDIFVHSWFDKSSVGKPLIGNYQNLGVMQAGDDKLILSLLNPKKTAFEAPISFDEFEQYKSSRVKTPNLASAAYSMKKSVDLMHAYELENGFRYDLVIKTRFDVLYEHLIYLQKLVPEVDVNTLYVSSQYQNHWTHLRSFETKSGKIYQPLSDCFIFGSSDAMLRLSRLYDHFHEIALDIGDCNTAEGYYSYIATVMNSFQIIPIRIRYALNRRY